MNSRDELMDRAERLGAALPAPDRDASPQYVNDQARAATRLRIAACGRAVYALTGGPHSAVLAREAADLEAASEIIESASTLDEGVSALLALKADIARRVDSLEYGEPIQTLLLGSGNSARLAAEIASGNLDSMFGLLPSWMGGSRLGMLSLKHHRFDDPSVPSIPLAMGGFA